MASVRDIVDDWTFICLDADLNPLPEDRLIAFKEKLHNKLRSVSFSDACLPEHFALYVKNNGQIVSEQNSLPDSVWDFNTAKRTSEKLLKAAISLAKKKRSISLLKYTYPPPIMADPSSFGLRGLRCSGRNRSRMRWHGMRTIPFMTDRAEIRSRSLISKRSCSMTYLITLTGIPGKRMKTGT